jgi:hypothetical protein
MQTPSAASILLGKIVERINTGRFEDRGSLIHLVKRAADIEGVESVFQRILERDDQMAMDHLAEIRYGVLFKKCRFRPQFEPTGNMGPDLMISKNGVSAFVEVKRYRPKEGEQIPEEWGPHGTLQQYGDPMKAQLRYENDLRGKLRQIAPRSGVEHGVLAVWSDREHFEEVEFEPAVREVSAEATRKGLRFCMYGSLWVRPTCVLVSLPELFTPWMEDLGTTH